jgi:hypothetical protein
MMESEAMATFFGGIHAGWFGLSLWWYTKKKVGPAAPLFFGGTLAAHPAWWMSSFAGDCGSLKIMLAALFLVASTWLGLVVLSRLRRERRR